MAVGKSGVNQVKNGEKYRGFEKGSWPISRVLSHLAMRDSHSSRRTIARALKQPTR